MLAYKGCPCKKLVSVHFLFLISLIVEHRADTAMKSSVKNMHDKNADGLNVPVNSTVSMSRTYPAGRSFPAKAAAFGRYAGGVISPEQ